MKRVCLAIVLACCALSVFGQGTRLYQGADSYIDFTSYSCNFGLVARDAPPATREMIITNTGSEKLVIYSASVQCPCTSVSFPRKAIAPGAEAVIKLSYNARREHSGKFRKSVTFLTNSKRRPHVKIYVGGTVVASLPKNEPAPVQSPEQSYTKFTDKYLLPPPIVP